MKKCLIIGASGYTGAQLTQLILQHPNLSIAALVVSNHSSLRNQSFASVYPQYAYAFPQNNLIFQSMEDTGLTQTSINPNQPLCHWSDIDVVFLATPHQVSASLAEQFLSHNIQVIDLSGAFRLTQAHQFADYYGFEHPASALLSQAVYGLPEINRHLLVGAKLIAVAGCYPTAAILSLMPLLDPANGWVEQLKGLPVINAISGVSGAGRKASLTSSFCEVSLQAYGVDGHRHTPEIEQALSHDVIFTPHLGAFKRGIYSTVTVPINSVPIKPKSVKEITTNKTPNKTEFTQATLVNLYQRYYADSELVQISDTVPALSDVEQTPMVKMFVRLNADKGYLQIYTVIDNLLKGAAVNAIQCFNLSHGYPETEGLSPINSGYTAIDDSKQFHAEQQDPQQANSYKSKITNNKSSVSKPSVNKISVTSNVAGGV